MQDDHQTGVSILTDAYIVPPSRHPDRSMTLNDANGLPVRHAITHAKHTVHFPRYLPRAEREGIDSIDKCYLFCGVYFAHFGHFILESLARLWAYEAYKSEIDGLIFFTSNRNDPDPSTYSTILGHLGIEHPIIFQRNPVRCSKLIVPEQGISLGPLAGGTPTHRRFMRSRLSAIATPAKNCPKSIYLSRTGYGLKRGGMLCEPILERNLENQGYTICHPQNDSFEDQIATYLGAERIISSDSSALHLAGFLGREDQQIAILLRRKYGAVDLVPQLTAFSGKEPLVIDAIKRTWVHEGRKPANWGHYAELSFEDIQAQLCAAGFISADVEWRNIGSWLIKRALAEQKEKHGNEILPQPADIGAPMLDAYYFNDAG